MKSFLNSPKKPIIIDFSKQPEPSMPKWSKGRFLTGNDQMTKIELPLATCMTWKYQGKVCGYYVLKQLISAYSTKLEIGATDFIVEAGKPCPVVRKDGINGHYGLKALEWLKNNWLTLPPSMKDSLSGKNIYGLTDVMFDDVGGLSMPYVTFCTEEPTLGWYSLSHEFGSNERCLVNPRAVQITDLPVVEFIS